MLSSNFHNINIKAFVVELLCLEILRNLSASRCLEKATYLDSVSSDADVSTASYLFERVDYSRQSKDMVGSFALYLSIISFGFFTIQFL